MRVAVLGTCASGKSTVVGELRRRGHDAYVVSQEHSIVRGLWHHANPDFVVLLEAEYGTICQRRGREWPRWLYDLQRERLAEAKKHADVIVDTSKESVEQTIADILSAMSSIGPDARDRLPNL